MTKKKETEVMTTVNFIITKGKRELVITNKSYDWKLSLADHTELGQILTYYSETNTAEEVNEILTMLYYTTSTMLTDVKLADVVGDFFQDKLDNAQKEVVEIAEKEDAENIEETKLIHHDKKTADKSE